MAAPWASPVSPVTTLILLSLLAGSAMPVGAALARWDRLHPAILGPGWRHFIVAFGGGALLSAVALVLVPDGAEHLPTWAVALGFGAGGVVFCLLDIGLGRLKSSAGQMVAMLSDFVPEAIALGAAFAAGEQTGLLLALLIVLQNVPEGFNAFEELDAQGSTPPNRILGVFALLALMGPAAALSGYYLMADAPAITGGLMLFASGGILYLIFEDIAPEARLEYSWSPPLGAVAGFLLGLVGHLMLTG